LKAYLITTGILFALFSLGHVLELAAHWHSPRQSHGFIVGMAAIIVVSGALSAWAFTLLRRRSQRAA